MLLIIFLGILWLYLNNKREREGLEDGEEEEEEDPKPNVSAEKIKIMADDFKTQMAAAGLPVATSAFSFGGMNLFDELTSLVSQEIRASGKAEVALEEEEASTSVVNTVVPPNPFPDTTFFTGTKFSDAFCKINKGNPSQLNNQCASLTSENCNATDCCIWVNGTKCMAGNVNGPNTSISGANTDTDYYSYKYQCYGAGCSNKPLI